MLPADADTCGAIMSAASGSTTSCEGVHNSAVEPDRLLPAGRVQQLRHAVHMSCNLCDDLLQALAMTACKFGQPQSSRQQNGCHQSGSHSTVPILNRSTASSWHPLRHPYLQKPWLHPAFVLDNLSCRLLWLVARLAVAAASAVLCSVQTVTPHVLCMRLGSR